MQIVVKSRQFNVKIAIIILRLYLGSDAYQCQMSTGKLQNYNNIRFRLVSGWDALIATLSDALLAMLDAFSCL